MQFASRLSLVAFFAASMRGLISHTDFSRAVEAALLAMAVFYGLGLVLGELARLLVEENARTEVDRAFAREAESES